MDFDPAKVTADLAWAVRQFNEALELWTSTHQCVANFQWGYAPGGGKHLEVTSIDKIVYRKEAPSPRVIKTTLDQALKNADT